MVTYFMARKQWIQENRTTDISKLIFTLETHGGSAFVVSRGPPAGVLWCAMLLSDVHRHVYVHAEEPWDFSLSLLPWEKGLLVWKSLARLPGSHCRGFVPHPHILNVLMSAQLETFSCLSHSHGLKCVVAELHLV